MEIEHKHSVRQSAKAGFGAGFGSVFGKFFGCLGVLVVLALMTAMCSGDKKSNSSANSEPSGPAVEISAAELSSAFQQNEARAKLNYDGKPLLVTGVVKDIDLALADNPVVKLQGANEAYGMGVNQDGKMTDVDVNDLSQEAAARLDKGKSATFLCTQVDEVMGSAQLKNCTLK